MIIIPGFIIAWLTFPGVIVHEAAHMFFCRQFGVAILDVKFFRFATSGPAGYVIHEKTQDFKANFFISVGPFLINSLLCVIFCMPAYLPISIFKVDDPSAIFFAWLGISIGMHAFPSTQDARGLLASAKEKLKNGNAMLYLCYPLVWIIYVGNMLSIVWFDAIYAGCLGFGIPALLIRLIFGPAQWSVS